MTLNMAAPLSICTKEEQHSVIRFLWSEGVSGAKIHRRLSVQSRNSVLPQRRVYKWIVKLKNGCVSVMHDEGTRPPSRITTDDNIECIRDMVLLDRRVTLMKRQIVCKLVMVPPMKSSTIDLAFIKFVQDGS